VTFDDSEIQSFSLDLELVGGSIFITGSGRIIDVGSGIDDITFDLTTNGQTLPLTLNGPGNSGVVSFNSTPRGGATLGFDHSNPNGSGRTLSDFNVDFRDGANFGFNFNTVVVQVDADVDLVIGSTSTRLGLAVDIGASLNQFLYNQTPGNVTPVTAAGGFNAPGQITAGIAAQINAAIQDIILDTDVTVDLGTLGEFEQSAVSDFGLFGAETLTPQGNFPSGPFPQDLLAELAIDLSDFPLSFPIFESGTVVETMGDTRFNIQFIIQGTLVLSNLTYNLRDTLVGAVVSQLGDFDDDGDADGFDFLQWQRGESVDPLGTFALADWEANYGTGGGALSGLTGGIPEPSTLCLAGLGLAGMWASRRRRRIDA